MDDQGLIKKPFVDWYGIWPGHTGAWEDGFGVTQDPPVGNLQLKVQQAQKSEIFITRERPWEQRLLMPFCVLREDEKLKLWYKAAGDDGNSYIAYAESTDGFNWDRPGLGLQAYQGSKANNLLHPTEHFALQSIFVDPSAPPEERYKGISPVSEIHVDGVHRPEMTERTFFNDLVAGMVDQGCGNEEIAEKLELWHPRIMGAVSADGLTWQVRKEPLLELGKAHLDTLNIATYDIDRGEYAAYLRGRQDDRRAVIKTGGKAFDNWSSPRFVFMADPQDPFDDDVYNSCYCRYPGTDLHLMFPSFYHRLTATLDIQMAISRDGDLWSRPERKPIISRTCDGDNQYMAIYAAPNLVPLNDQEWGLMHYGTTVSHDIRRFPSYDPSNIHASLEYRWATWKRDRLVALEATGETRFTANNTAQLGQPCQGHQLRLNYKTESGGWLKVELVQPHTPYAMIRPISAFDCFGMEESDVLTGDELSKVATWKGKSDLSVFRDRSVSVRIHMSRAKLFSISL